MDSRNFSERVQYKAVLLNLEKNDGQLRCDSCKQQLKKKSECHFDHIFPYAKGGKSTIENCQVLCGSCNLSKNDKELHVFALEQKAKKFIFGDGKIDAEPNAPSENQDRPPEKKKIKSRLAQKKEIAERVLNFVANKGDVSKADLFRAKNNLPTITQVRQIWGGLKQMKAELGIKAGIQDWNRETIKTTLEEWIKDNGGLIQAELTSKNSLPSLPCVLRYYPECRNFTGVKQLFGLARANEDWTKEKVLAAGKKFIKAHGPHLRQHHLGKDFGLPSSNVINRYFGGLREFQRAIGASVNEQNIHISRIKILHEVEGFFKGSPRVIKNRSDFFEKFKFSNSAVAARFGSITAFLAEAGISESAPKKSSYTKDEIDNLVAEFISNGGQIPMRTSELTKLGLPSADSIHKFYDSWREPFIFYSRMMEKKK